MDVPRFDRGSTGYVSMLIELSDLSLYLLSYTALVVIDVFFGLLPAILDKFQVTNGGDSLVSELNHHVYRSPIL
jgi:hypothetical protein